jgi:hypothetical protein
MKPYFKQYSRLLLLHRNCDLIFCLMEKYAISFVQCVCFRDSVLLDWSFYVAKTQHKREFHCS